MTTHAENFVKGLSKYVILVKKYLLSIGFTLIFFGLQPSHGMEDNLSPSSPPIEGYVKVRIWNSNLGQGIAGHVSLQTCVSYISLWPNDEGNSIAHYDSTLARKLGSAGEFVFNAPAIGMRFYKQDRMNEDNQDPDHVYLVQANTEKIDEIAVHLLDIGEYEMTDDLFIMHEKYRWYAPGQNKSFSDGLENGKIYLNCASSVMLALYFGGIEEAYFNRVFNQKEAFAHLFKAFSNSNTSE